MMSRFASHGYILAAPWQQRRTERSFGAIIMIVSLLAVLGAVIGFLKGGDFQAMLQSYASLTAGGVVVLWLLQITYMKLLNHPIHARLVPGHLRKLRQTALVYWLTSSMACGLILGLVFGNILKWSFFVAFIEVIVLTPLLWPGLWLIALGLLLPPWWPREAISVFFREALQPLYVDWPLLSLTFLLLPCGYILTHKLIQSGDPKHIKGYFKSRRMLLATSPDAHGHQPSLHHLGFKGTLIMNVVLFPLHRYMQHLVAKPRRTPAHVLSRAELVFGADAHWVMQASGLIGITAVALLVAVVEMMQYGFVWRAEIMESSGFVALFLLLFGASFPMGMRHALSSTRREQALLTLLPGMPRGGTLNRWIAGRLLHQCALAWIFAAAVASQLQYQDSSAMKTAAIYAGILPAFAMLIQDWSRLQVQRPLKIVISMALVGLGALGCYGLMSELDWSPYEVGILSAAGSAALVAWRWRKLKSFPSALPAGRLTAL